MGQRIDAGLRANICNWGHDHLSVAKITGLVSEEGAEVSIRSMERILLAGKELPELPRRIWLKLGLSVHEGPPVEIRLRLYK